MTDERLNLTGPTPDNLPDPQVAWDEFESELESAINRCSMENGSNTPDFILAEYLTACLKAFNAASRHRERWYGRSLSIGGAAVTRHDAEWEASDEATDGL